LGEIVITDLNNYCMPLIRFRTGDFGVAVSPDCRCACGRGLPRLESVTSSQAPALRANNKVIPATFFTELFKDYDYLIDQYQVVQKSSEVITLRIKKADRFSAAEFDKVISTMRLHLGVDVSTEVEFVDVFHSTEQSEQHGLLKPVASTRELEISARF
jgi:phenylacetate-CoA ligase